MENSTPKHIAIIIDGNRRYAKKQGTPSIEGHRAGAETFERVIGWCADLGVSELTIWALSTENLKRNKQELDSLFSLMEKYCDRFISDEKKAKATKKKTRIRFIGDLAKLPESLVKKMREVESSTAKNQEFKINILVNYGGKWELVEAMKQIASDIEQKKISAKDITADLIEKNLKLTSAPDLIIRTGQSRLSGFLPWQSGYSEIIFLENKLWPEFTKEDLIFCIKKFSEIKQNFGK